MLHPSYSDLMDVVNSGVEEGDTPVVNSRYSIVMATSKRARQIIAGAEPQVNPNGKKALSMAVEELATEKIHILGEQEAEVSEEMLSEFEEAFEEEVFEAEEAFEEEAVSEKEDAEE